MRNNSKQLIFVGASDNTCVLICYIFTESIFSVLSSSCVLILWKMSVNIVKDIDGDYAVEVLGNISENYDLREVTLVAAIDEQE